MASGKRRKYDDIHMTPDVSYITNPDVAHEESDVAVRPLLWFVGGLTLFTIVTCLAMFLMFKFFLNRELAQELAPSPLARQGEERLPPEPRLQLAPGWQVETDGKGRTSHPGHNAGYVPQPWRVTMVKDVGARAEGYAAADEQAAPRASPSERNRPLP